jgi:hypothetical protein
MLSPAAGPPRAFPAARGGLGYGDELFWAGDRRALLGSGAPRELFDSPGDEEGARAGGGGGLARARPPGRDLAAKSATSRARARGFATACGGPAAAAAAGSHVYDRGGFWTLDNVDVLSATLGVPPCSVAAFSRAA